MLALYRELLALRRHPTDVLAYLRGDGDERSLVLLNFGILPRPVDLTSLLGPESSAVPLLRTRTDGPSGVAEGPSSST
jgi:alpha-glucosidase